MPRIDGWFAVRSTGVQTWAIGAGVIRSLRGMNCMVSWRRNGCQIGTVYYDPTMPMGTRQHCVRGSRSVIFMERKWDVVNQAHVHHWFAREWRSFEAYSDLTQAIASGLKPRLALRSI